MSSVQEAVADLDESQALKEIRRRIEKGEDPDKILEEARRGLHIIGERFNAKEYALIELEMADELFKECVKTVKSLSGRALLGHSEKVEGRTLRLSKKTDMGRVD
jgi:methanogenic corrinoid protein MtbC1